MPAVESAIRQGDCVEAMRAMEAGSIDLVFADPPFNIGFEYDNYNDEQSDTEYLDWSRAWMEEVHRILKPNGTFWLAIGDEYAADLKVIAERQIGYTTRSWVIWYYTFGVNCKRKFSRSHAHLFHFVKDPDQFTFNADDPAVRVPSARALVYGDKRANPLGRLPDDTWILRPQDFQSDRYGFDAMDDTWYFARVAGTFKERQGFHGCQMPEQLLGRIVRVSSNPGDQVFDPFSGSGTTLAVAKKLGRKFSGCELSEEYVRYSTNRLEGVREYDALDGPADPIASAPTTANGRRLNGQALLPLFDAADFAPADAAVELPKSPSAANLSTAPLGTGAMATNTLATVPAIKAESKSTEDTSKQQPIRINLRKLQRTALAKAYSQVAAGYSLESLLADPALQSEFYAACEAAGLMGDAAIWNRELMELDKSGKLAKGKQPKLSSKELDACQFAAEIAWQQLQQKLNVASVEQLLVSPTNAAQFDRLAARYAPGFSEAAYRRALVDLHRNHGKLIKEAKAYDYVFATRKFDTNRKLSARAAKSLDGVAGVYLLTGTGRAPLFVGESLDLGARLAMHATAPGTKTAVSNFSVILESDLPSSEYRAPLKVDLVRRYQPEWNIG